MYHLRARYMNPDTGRFWTQDSYEGGKSDPPSLHKYTYARGNSVNRVDPSGYVDLAELNVTMGISNILAAEAALTFAPMAGEAALVVGGETALAAGVGTSAEIAVGAVSADSILAFSLSSKFAAASAFVFSAIAGTIAAGSSSDSDDDERERKVYRVIRPDEDPALGLFAKDVTATYTPEGHVINGSRPGFRSQYISTTAKWSVAEQWAGRTGNRIVAIDLDKVPSLVIDLSTEAGRDLYLKGRTAKNFAKASAEVLIEKYVPPAAVSLVY